jgi:hypothetical protein
MSRKTFLVTVARGLFTFLTKRADLLEGAGHSGMSALIDLVATKR